MIKLGDTNIADIRLGDAPIARVYQGDTLVWGEEEDFDGFLIKGKFTDDSRASDWHFWKNGSISTANRVELADYVNPVTKEFEYRSDEKPTTLHSLFQDTKIEHIYKLSGTENVEDFGYMFRNCPNLKSVNLKYTDASKITSLYCTFNSTALEELDISHWNTSKVNNFRYAFSGSDKLHTLKANLDFSSLTSTYNATGIFDNTLSLTTIEGVWNGISLNQGADYHFSPLTNESAMVIINGLKDGANSTITFSKTTFTTLTEEQIAIATAKGWSVVSA